MSKDKEVIKNIFFGFIYKPIGIIISFLTIPLSINYLGNTNYGLWATILSIISWISFFDIGIGNGLRNYLSKEIALKDYRSAREYIATGYIIIFIISLGSFFLIALSFYLINWNIVFNTDILINKELLFIMILNLLFMCTNFFLNLIKTILYSVQKSSVIGVMQVATQLLNLGGLYLLLRGSFSSKLVGITIVYGLGTLIVNIIVTIVFFRRNKVFLPKIKEFRRDKIKSLTGLGMKFFVIQLAGVIVFTTDNLIITKLFGPQEVTPYSITFKIFSTVIMLHGIIVTPIWSAVTKAYAEKDKEWIKKILKKLNLFQLIIASFVGLLCYLFPHIVRFWIKSDVLVSKSLILSFGIYVIISTFCNNYAYIINGIGNLNFQMYLSIFQGLINIPISIYCAKNLDLGISGVIIGTNITLIIGLILYPFKIKKIVGV